MQSGAGGVASQYTRQQTDNFTTSASQVNLLNEVNDETDAGTYRGQRSPKAKIQFKKNSPTKSPIKAAVSKLVRNPSLTSKEVEKTFG